VVAKVKAEVDVASEVGSLRLWDGTTVIDEEEFEHNANSTLTVPLGGIFNVASAGSAITLSVQSKAGTGNITMRTMNGGSTTQGAIEWTIFPLDGQMPAPVIISGQEAVTFTHEVASGNDGGAPTTGAWTKRTLNTTYNPLNVNWASVSSSVITLTPGTYDIVGYALHHRADNVKIRLQNTTDASTTLVGSNGEVNGASVTQVSVPIQGVFSITATKSMEFQYFVTTDGDGGGGRGLGIQAAVASTNEVYAGVTLRRIR